MDEERPRRWKRAGSWFVGSTVAAMVSFVHVVANTDLIMTSRHDPLVTTPVAAVALFFVLTAPSVVILGTLAALRRTPLHWSGPTGISVAVLLVANLVFTLVGVADGVSYPKS